ncbi:hypothetical protein [Fodinicola feengrottensis]|uniref:hypothetical protein n=1 Tax=Fodinicola feengrottensis TaxID=435914 RepID=UPI0013D0517C|nr:hypothetical protein [Fodinicola feengrottensis]
MTEPLVFSFGAIAPLVPRYGDTTMHVMLSIRAEPNDNGRWVTDADLVIHGVGGSKITDLRESGGLALAPPEQDGVRVRLTGWLAGTRYLYLVLRLPWSGPGGGLCAQVWLLDPAAPDGANILASTEIRVSSAPPYSPPAFGASQQGQQPGPPLGSHDPQAWMGGSNTGGGRSAQRPTPIPPSRPKNLSRRRNGSCFAHVRCHCRRRW